MSTQVEPIQSPDVIRRFVLQPQKYQESVLCDQALLHLPLFPDCVFEQATDHCQKMSTSSSSTCLLAPMFEVSVLNLPWVVYFADEARQSRSVLS